MGMDKQARVFLVGTGPGDPELLTMKAYRLIQQADVIIYDRLVSGDILNMIPAGVTRIYAGKKSGCHSLNQAEINRLLSRLGSGNRMIVRLKGGDPFVFGRGSEEAMWLAERNIKFEIVPGITAASACTAYAGIPLTHRGLAHGIQVITGHSRDNGPLKLDWQSLADPDKTIVIYMGLANIRLITNKLIEYGMAADTPAAAIENGTLDHQRKMLCTLAELPNECDMQKIRPPVIFVIGKVVALATQLDWYNWEQEDIDNLPGNEDASYA
jgi:uroporphyrin-III C-methyltransferase/precorrin-2 dehydrogenase/sirohydrochlorin ferrochelatase/uroporphyrin-III C-methyltransferase